MNSHTITPLSGAALFTTSDFYEINQLADLLFNENESHIHLQSEHELVTRAWILSALKNSLLAKKEVTPPVVVCGAFESGSEKISLFSNTWIYDEAGELIRANIQKSGIQKNIVHLHLPALTTDLRVKILQQFCIETLHTHLLTIPLHTIRKTVEWQARYCADQNILTEAMLVLQRAVNRFLLTHEDDKQAAFLEPHHIAEVLVDWQHVSLSNLLRPSEDLAELKHFLTEHIVGQNAAIDAFLQAKTKSHHSFFILSGSEYSGKRSFVESVAQFSLGATCFCIPLNLSFFDAESQWSSIFLPTPHNDKRRMNIIELVEQYPQAIIMITHAHENPELLEKLCYQIKRKFFHVNNQYISIENITWMVLLDTIAPENVPDNTSTIIQESIFSINPTIELSDILYRPNIGPLAADELHQTDEKYAIEAVKKQFSAMVLANANILPFLPLLEKDKKLIINKEIKRIIHHLKSAYNVPVYYQEEVVQFLLTQANQANKGLEVLHKNLHHQIEKVLLKALESGVLIDGQVFMLQLNDTGRVLQMVRTATRTGTTQSATQSQTLFKL